MTHSRASARALANPPDGGGETRKRSMTHARAYTRTLFSPVHPPNEPTHSYSEPPLPPMMMEHVSPPPPPPPSTDRFFLYTHTHTQKHTQTHLHTTTTDEIPAVNHLYQQRRGSRWRDNHNLYVVGILFLLLNFFFFFTDSFGA